MFCPRCGQNNQPESTFCTYCGAPLTPENEPLQLNYPPNPYVPPQAPYQPYQPYQYPPYPPMEPVRIRQNNPCAIAGFVLSLISIFFPYLGMICALVGVILSGIGISQINRQDQDGKGFAIAGVIISSVILFFYVLIIIFAVTAIATIPWYY